MSLTVFPTYQHFQAVYGEEPHTNCYLIRCEKGRAEPWQVHLIIERKELREVIITIASKQQMKQWCKKSLKIVRWNMRQVIGDLKCSI